MAEKRNNQYKDFSFEPDYSVPPGETLKEILAHSNITIDQFCDFTTLTKSEAIDIINGNAPITLGMAKTFEALFDVPALFWINLQKNYEK